MVEGARLESVFRGNSNVGSNPTLSASPMLEFSASLISISRLSTSLKSSASSMPFRSAFPEKYSQTLRAIETGTVMPSGTP